MNKSVLAPIFTQPQVENTAQLLRRNYQMPEGLMIDVYGNHDEAGYEVTDVTLAGSNISLYEIIEAGVLKDLTDWCNRYLPTGEQLRLESRDDHKISLAEADAGV